MTIESTALQKAWFTINKLKQRLQIQQQSITQPIAIVGLSCRFSQAKNKYDFWQLLQKGKNVISKFPEARWELLKETHEAFQRNPKHPYWGSFLSNIDQFDAYFFGITPREALRMDIQQRLLLEVSYEAFEDAGFSLDKLAQSNTGVFVSVYSNPFGYLQKLEKEIDALYISTGNASSIAANRLSYVFDLHGPSLVVDTACSSSLVATHIANLYLQNNLCDTALVAAANVNLFPSINLLLAEAKMLSPDGQCKTFDADANGYVQGEGAGALVLKKLSKAIADQDRIYGVIIGSGVNQDGKTNGLTAPNGLQQEQLLRSVYSQANLNPNHLSYVECHGTGTYLGDPIEVQALGEVISSERDPTQPCWIGSVKTNMGHLEPAAGVTSLIKCALSLQSGQIPPHLNVKKPNPLIDFRKYHFQIPVEAQNWPKYGEYRMAGINGFGFGGTNAHIVMREFLETEKQQETFHAPPQTEIFTISAKDPESLHQLIFQWINYLKLNRNLSLAQLAYNVHVNRSHFFHRAAIVAASIDELSQGLIQLHQHPGEKLIIKTNDNELKKLAEAYLKQEMIDWQSLEASRRFPYLDMPIYQWQHKVYWPHLSDQQQQLEKGEVELYPFQGTFISSPLKTLQFNFIFSTENLPEIKDTYNILHFGYYMEMIAFICDSLGLHEFTVENMRFISPILVPDQQKMNVQVILKPEKDNKLPIRFYSRSDQQTQWQQHAKTKLWLQPASSSDMPSQEKIKARARIKGDSDMFYSKIRGMDMPADGSIRWVHDYWLGDNEIFCELKKPAMIIDNDHYRLNLHFSVLDACIQALFLTLPPDIQAPFVAEKIQHFHFFGLKGIKLFLYAKLDHISASGESFQGQWHLIDENNNVIAQCEKIIMKQLTKQVKLERVKQVKEKLEIDWAPLSMENLKIKVMHYLREQVAMVFAMPQEDVDVLLSLAKMGIDSLMALILMRSIESGLGVTYSMQTLLQGPSIADIADYVISEKHKNRTITEKKTWIAYHKPKPKATLRLFCFPYGGAGASIYRNWAEQLPETIDVCPIQLPGREDRIHETSFSNINPLIEALIDNLKSEFNLPFAFFGHSVGALIAFELAYALVERHLPQPDHLFLSAFPNPSLPTKSLDLLLSKLKQKNIDLFDIELDLMLEKLPEDQLVEIVTIFNEYGMTDYQTEIITPKSLKLLLPIFIADINLVKNYLFINKKPLNIPITIFSGKKDTWVALKDMKGWAEHSAKSCNFVEINSGHLFIQKPEYLKQVLIEIQKRMLL